MDPTKITVVANWEVPKSFRDVQVFLGYANLYRRSIAGLCCDIRRSCDRLRF